MFFSAFSISLFVFLSISRMQLNENKTNKLCKEKPYATKKKAENETEKKKKSKCWQKNKIFGYYAD